MRWSLIAAVLALLLSIGSATPAVLAQGGRFSARLDVFTHFTPFYLALSLIALPFAFWAAKPARLPALIAIVLGVGLSCTLMLPEYLAGNGPAADDGETRPLKLVQFNAWGRNPIGEAAAAWILAQRPDVIVLEEGGALRGALLKAGYHRTCQGCGAAVFSRAEPIAGGQVEEDPRGFLSAATLQDDAGPFTVIAVHRHWPTRIAQNAVQAAEFRAVVSRYPLERLIIAGDFNSTPWSFARRREDRELGLIHRTRHLFTWPAEQISHNRLPAPFPYLPIDHVYAGPGWATVSVERGPRLGSDHYPVVVTLAPVRSAAR